VASELPLSPHVRGLPPYPFAHLDELRAAVAARGIDVIDLSIGDLREPTPRFISDALAAGIPERSSYPRAVGIPELRSAVAAWVRGRFGVELDAAEHVLPTNGSKEAVFTLPLAVLDRSRRPLVLAPDPGYPVYALGTDAAGGELVPLPLLEENGFLPDLGAVGPDMWRRASILWLNVPNNPTGAVASLDYLRNAAARCREHGVLLAADEAYTELYLDDPPPSALQTGLDNVIVLHTLSKRSGLSGFRSGFLAGDPRLIAALKRFRPGVGVATPQFVQRAAAAAWSDETHVAAFREKLRERHEAAVAALLGMGYRVAPSRATIYLWVRVPDGETSASFAEHVLERGVCVFPGSAMGAAGEGWFRLSLTADPDRLREAADRLAGRGSS